MNQDQSLRAKIRADASMVASGLFVTVPLPVVVERAALAGYDFVIVDLQHTTISESELQVLAIAGMARGISVLARISNKSPEGIGRVLDTGVEGVFVPMVQSSSEVLASVRSAHRPPKGERSWMPGTRAAGLKWQSLSFEEGDVAYSNYELGPKAQPAIDDPFVGALIETKEGIADIDRILAVPYLDAIFPTTSDMRASLRTTDMSEEEAVAAVDSAWEDILRRFPRPDGPMLTVALNRRNWSKEKCLEHGVRMVIHGNDMILMSAALELVRATFV